MERKKTACCGRGREAERRGRRTHTVVRRADELEPARKVARQRTTVDSRWPNLRICGGGRVHRNESKEKGVRVA
ncbi:hypothetical protein PAHAL_5G327600 [Panicum hallii]|uniref:Uncharacterized protein n=1 Tax=Panicum hallii TaxID=206008 RepID=A0A2S3HV82_9POAL|nr:hypothetical protein PAHAL_5G327600 [Panicum hallii]